MRIPLAELRARADRLGRRLAACDLCPRRCGVNRLQGELGFCRVGEQALLAAAVAHHGEEPPLSGTRGAGTLFFGGCNLRCSFCQNHQISRCEIPLREVDAETLAGEMLRLQAAGCHNIEVVTPSHVVPQILAALAFAVAEGLDLPLVYNSGGYDAVDTVAALDGVIDVYLPDLKYAAARAGARLSQAPDYFPVARAALQEMVRQCGACRYDAEGLMRRGVIVRHLVLPDDLAKTGTVLAAIADLRPRPALSLLAQFYPPPGRDDPALQRTLLPAEYERACDHALALDLEEGWIQSLDAPSTYRPDFSRADPFPR